MGSYKKRRELLPLTTRRNVLLCISDAVPCLMVNRTHIIYVNARQPTTAALLRTLASTCMHDHQLFCVLCIGKEPGGSCGLGVGSVRARHHARHVLTCVSSRKMQTGVWQGRRFSFSPGRLFDSFFFKGFGKFQITPKTFVSPPLPCRVFSRRCDTKKVGS